MSIKVLQIREGGRRANNSMCDTSHGQVSSQV